MMPRAIDRQMMQHVAGLRLWDLSAFTSSSLARPVFSEACKTPAFAFTLAEEEFGVRCVVPAQLPRLVSNCCCKSGR